MSVVLLLPSRLSIHPLSPRRPCADKASPCPLSHRLLQCGISAHRDNQNDPRIWYVLKQPTSGDLGEMHFRTPRLNPKE